MALKYLEPTIREYLLDFYGDQVVSLFEYLEDANYVLHECSHCGLIYQYETPNIVLLKRLYNGDNGSTDHAAVDHNHRPQVAAIDDELVWVADYLGRPAESLKVLDFGMGWGDWCLGAKALGCDVYGSELSESRLAHARRLGIKTVDWDGMKEHAFDFIHTEQVFEHLAEPGETLRHLAPCLREGGLIKLSVPDGADIHRRIAIADWKAPKGTQNSLNAVAPLEHLNCFHRRSLLVMAEQSGMVSVPLGFPRSSSPISRLKACIRPWVYRLRNPELFRFIYTSTNAFFQKVSAS